MIEKIGKIAPRVFAHTALFDIFSTATCVHHRALGIRTRILELEGFLFFGSTIQILNKFKALVATNEETPFPERVRYFICDFRHAKNIDHSSCLTFKDLKQMASINLVVLVFTGMNTKVLSKMRAHGVLPEEGVKAIDDDAVVVHSDLDHGAE